ncbi:hypothetical protein [Amycolatopsis sp. PS_44_ISF1]|uniref:hypothetical protein n=1 Tax=Amycolatopsis sp. PS_44_ISF1 TaxID=2974917 RepID=UPI0028E08188|nr:hypothetical protein [Amycolatopsis sp. PS_44_ISF1]MDT8912336.1 hypothetical protein [Amycolatopsis sp. PS_44_ISF1]
MSEFAIGDTVQITAQIMKGNVGTVVHLDEKTGKYLVRIGGATQNYFTAQELKKFDATKSQ